VITILPPLFAALATTALFAALFALWRSIRAVLSPEAGTIGVEGALASTRSELLARKEQLLADLHDLELEHDGGKIDDADFETMQGKIRGRAKGVLRSLDEDAAPYRAEAEALVEKRLAGAVSKKKDDKAFATEKPAKAEPASRACASCATKNDVDAEFCKKCGKPLAKEGADV